LFYRKIINELNQWAEGKDRKTGSLRSLHQFADRANHPYAIRLYAGPLEKIQTKTPEGKSYTLLPPPISLPGRYMITLNG